MIDAPPAPPIPPRRKELLFDVFTHFFDLAGVDEVMLEPGLTIERVVFHTTVGLDRKTVVKLVVKRRA